MSQINTGLGWSAKQEWLMGSVGVIAEKRTVGGPDFPDQPIPKNLKTAADVVSGGLMFFHYQQRYFGQTLYAAADGEEDIVIAGMSFVVNPNGSVNYGLRYISPIQDAAVNIATVTTGSGAGTTISTHTLSSFDPGTNLYFYQVLGTINPVNDEYEYYTIPVYSDLADAMPNVQVIDLPFYKLNPGYAVACVTKWFSIEGLEISAPVLISSNAVYTAISTDGSTVSPDMSTFDFLYQGMRFYMSLIGGSVELYTILETANLEQFGAAMPSKIFSLLVAESFSNVQVLDAPDPYGDEGGGSGEEGGDGEEPTEDPVEEETLPLPSVAGHGFCTIYVPSSQELLQMSAYLWSGAFNVDQVIKLFSSPMDSILGLSAVPVDLVGSPEQIYLGGVPLPNITMPKYTGRTSVKVDFGNVTVSKRWGSYLDYSPYTDFSIYLPFIGIKSIKADDIMGKTVNLTYSIDILSGGCVAYLRPAGGSVLYEWSGQCALQIPVTGRSYDNVFQSAMSVATAAVAAVSAPASAPVLSGAVASAAVQAAATKPHIERSGTVNGITGFLGQLRPYLIRTIPEAYIPENQNKFIGYPAYINVDLSTVKGYNEVDSIHLENVTATGPELDEIENILKGGVIF